jgi:cytochrome c oxidase assembly protein subunit 15
MLELQSPGKNGLPAMRPLATWEASSSDWHPRLHAWAILTMLIALIGVVTGSLVTSLDVGLEDLDWPTAPWHLLTTPSSAKRFGYLVEHTHRLADYLTGIFVIGLTIGTWKAERRTWVRRLGIITLLAVILQGVLGGLRIKEDYFLGTELRIIHGCSAHLFLALLGVVALVTSHGWCAADGRIESSRRVRVAALALASAVYGQIIFGAMLRHTSYSPLGQRGHLLFAMIVVALATWLAVLFRSEGGMAGMRRLLFALKGLLVLQVLLGVETWLKRFRNGPFTYLPPASGREFYLELALRTTHHLVGALLFVTAVMFAVYAFRSVFGKSPVRSSETLEGVA